jgi:competence protein ComEA
MSRGSSPLRRSRRRGADTTRERPGTDRAVRAGAGRHRRAEDPVVEVRAHREAEGPPWWRRIPRPSPAALAGIAILVLIAAAAVHLTGQGSALPSNESSESAASPAISTTGTGGPGAAAAAPGATADPSAPATGSGADSAPATDPDAAPAEVSQAPGTDSTGTGAEGTVVVYVSGAVESPGVVELPAGSRVDDALEDAGGAQKDADLGSVNLARVLVDAEQIHVPEKGEEGATNGTGPDAAAQSGPAGSEPMTQAAPGGAAGGSDGAEAGGALVDINTADAAALEALPGVGPAIAQRIVEHREQNGPFSSVDALTEVSGIGPATLEKIRPQATV